MDDGLLSPRPVQRYTKGYYYQLQRMTQRNGQVLNDNNAQQAAICNLQLQSYSRPTVQSFFLSCTVNCIQGRGYLEWNELHIPGIRVTHGSTA